MDALTTVAASGMRARLESLDILANNIANAPTPGFKADREFYNTYIAVEAEDSPPGASPAISPVVERHWTDFSQGALTATANPLDLAISGSGFFVVSGPSGRLLTRDGGFRVSLPPGLATTGELQTKEGYAVRGKDGKPIRVDPGKELEITRDGSVRQEGQEIGRLELVNVKDAAALAKRGQNYFAIDGADWTPLPATQAEVQQGKIEASNAQPAETAVRLVTVMRQFEMLQRAVAIGAEMNRRSVEEVARVAGP